MPADITLNLDDLQDDANQLRQASARTVAEVTRSGYTRELSDQWKTIQTRMAANDKDIRWLEQRLIDITNSPIEDQLEAPPRFLVPYLVLEQLGIYPPYSLSFNPKSDQSRLAHAGLYLTNIAGQNIGYQFYPTWIDTGRRGLILASRHLPEVLLNLDEITYPHFRLHHEKHLTTPAQEQVGLAKPILSVPEQVDLPRHEWAELLAAVHYAHSAADEETPQSLLQRMLPTIGVDAHNYVPQAEETLKNVGLFPAASTRRLHIDPAMVEYIEVRTSQGTESYESPYPSDLEHNAMTCFLHAKDATLEASSLQELLDQCADLAYKLVETPRVLAVAFIDEKDEEVTLIKRCETCDQVGCRQHL